MCGRNQTWIPVFTLLGFGDLFQMKYLLFAFFLLLYIAALIGNSLIIGLIVIARKLHSPMYFFLGNLSLCEIFFSNFVFPHILYLVWGNGGPVSLYYVIGHTYVCTSAGVTEILLLSIMAVDRYFAICNPLRYPTLMNLGTCSYLVLMAWLSGLIIPSISTIQIYSLKICPSETIDVLFCELLCILEMSSTDTNIIKMEILVFAAVLGLFPVILVILSYVFIFSTILTISSKDGRMKTFSTCSAHLTSVFLYFGAIFLMYLVSSLVHSKIMKKIITLVYTVLIILLNPLIYSLRNQEMKASLMSCIPRFKSNIQRHCCFKGPWVASRTTSSGPLTFTLRHEL